MGKDNVGVSYRTSGKHDALNRYLGRTAGSMYTVFRNKRLFIIDCTAGNGQSTKFSVDTSPGIACKHADWLKRKGVNVQVVFFEKSAANAAKLKETPAGNWPINVCDASEMPPFWTNDDVLFVMNDPNTMSDWALPKAMMNAPDLTTVFSTLGCNVGGLKRLPYDDRRVWYDHTQSQIALLRNWHDALIVTLDGDSSQWAYMVNAPAKWRDEVEAAFNKAFEYSPHALRYAWYKQDRQGFDSIKNHLFLTKKENTSVLPPIKNSKGVQNEIFI